MSTQNRTNANSKAPVSSHPLFPAIVALWFGALFGLGSLAVRVTLIESLIISSHIDVIVPMAAPPLGMTARILIALTMAMIGIAAGALIARRIARPKPAVPNRRRTAGSVSEARKAEFVRQVQIQQEEQRIAADKADAVRRRALASGEADPYNAHRDAAPLPGGTPQNRPNILDVTQFDLGAPGSFETDLPKGRVEVAPLDLDGFDAPQVAPQVAASAFAEPAQGEAPAPGIASYGDDTDSFRAKFANEKKPVEWTPEPPPGHPATFAASAMADDAPEFAAETAAPIASRRFDPVPVEAAAQPQAEAGLEQRGSGFAAPFALTDGFVDLGAEPGEVPAPEPTEAVAAPEAAPATSAEQPEAEHEPQIAAFLPRASAAERIAASDLAELSPVELVERFALALQQRRHSGAFPAGLLETAAAFDLPVRPQPSQVPEVLAAMAPPVEPAAAQAPAAPAAQVAAAPLFAATAPASPDIGDAPVAAPVALARLPLTLPAAMRPIEFGNHHEEHDDLPDYVPPRSFAMPRLADHAELPDTSQPVCADPELAVQDNAQNEPAPLAASAVAMPVETGAGSGAESDVNEEGYSSLLALSRSAPLRQTFVRIEEPAGEFSQAEPVVIFPGQATRPGTRFARPSDNAAPVEAAPAPLPSLAEAPAGGAPALRRFDAPGATAPAAASGNGAMQDPAEAERALRSALATLQRMSGAA